MWCIIFLLRHGKRKQHWYFSALALLGAIYLFADACTVNYTSSYRTTAVAYLINLFVAPSLSLFCWAYLRAIKTANENHSGAGYLIAIPTTFATVGLICLGVSGIGDAEKFIRIYESGNFFHQEFTDPIFDLFNMVCVEGFSVILGISCAAIILYIIVDLIKTGFSFKGLFRFFFKKENFRVLHLQDLSFLLFIASFVLRMALGRKYLLSHEVFTMFFYLITGIFCLLICLIASYAEYYYLALSDFFIPRVTIDKEKIKPVKEEEENDEEIIEDDETVEADEEEEDEDVDYSNISISDALVKRFMTAMHDEKMYLISGLTIKDICEKIGSNKTYVSKIVNEAYHMPFPHYVNYLRVEYAKTNILEHP
ncbi:MAG: hypothetical protein MJZ16_04090, partial [Bacteroidales bacterium]|nr:hypothetical protein [Bacteroidales bacterium]